MKKLIAYIALLLFVSGSTINYVNLVTQDTTSFNTIIEIEEDGEEDGEEFSKDVFAQSNIDQSEPNTMHLYLQVLSAYPLTLKYESVSLGVLAPPPDNTLSTFV